MKNKILLSILLGIFLISFVSSLSSSPNSVMCYNANNCDYVNDSDFSTNMNFSVNALINYSFQLGVNEIRYANLFINIDSTIDGAFDNITCINSSNSYLSIINLNGNVYNIYSNHSYLIPQSCILANNEIYLYHSETSTTVFFYELWIDYEINPIIVYPNESQFSISPTHLDYILSGNPDLCEYSINGGIINNSLNCGENVTGLTANEGVNTWLIALYNISNPIIVNISNDYYNNGVDGVENISDGLYETAGCFYDNGDFAIINYTLPDYHKGDINFSIFHADITSTNFTISCFNDLDEEISSIEIVGHFPPISDTITYFNFTENFSSECINNNQIKLKILRNSGGTYLCIRNINFEYNPYIFDVGDSVTFELLIPETIEDKGEIYNIMNSVGAGLGIFIEDVGVPLLSIFVIILFVGFIGLIFYELKNKLIDAGSP